MLARPAGLTSTSTGRISAVRGVSYSQMNAIWKVARTGSIRLRIVAGTWQRCANLTFPVAKRITIPALSINLPVIGGPDTYPPCNVAMYLKPLWQPREPGVTFVYAHARTGMFLPLLERSKINDGASLIGMTIRVYTGDSKLNTYKIDKVRRHVTSAQDAVGVTRERLWLQTSEGPNWTYPKLIVEAHRVSTTTASYAASHPTPHPIAC